MGTVESLAKARPSPARTRMLDVALAAILSKGFDATTIEEIVAGAEVTRSGFFYHFRDKNQLARALLERYVEEDDRILDDVFRRGHELSDDPLQALLISLRLFAELFGDIPNGHPGCMVATICYQERLFDAEVRTLNREATLGWRRRFLGELEGVARRYPPRDAADLSDLADMISTAVEGGIVMAKATGDPALLPRQILLLRSYFKLLFTPA
ncbi:TetR/AcrR family transcriptional regulator [Amaricoccus sp.]|uniref:TetR/AcrR family transcriptional regulator n=1 Tax=Amaricoccus sp. TaxID=1872485 RepID=UPI001B5F8553|nr:TetR/AcrR family transcriptional regulator [Amaricoccus sp.]MBP7241681.1 TetR/AcrR family transcriptional regulator [Amaricoccus sp.]